MNPGVEGDQVVLLEKFKEAGDIPEQEYGLEQLLSTEYAQVGPFRDGYVDEIIAGTADDASLDKEGDGKKSRHSLEMPEELDSHKRNGHQVSEKKRRSIMRNAFAQLGELVTECRPRKRSRAEVLFSASNYIMELDRQTKDIENSIRILRAEVAKIHQD